MKNILFKAFEEDGQRIYVYELPEEAELDEDALDLCEDGALKGLVSMEYVDDADAFYYDVTGYKTLAKAVSGEVDSSDVLETLYGLAKVLVELKENNVPLSYLLLHKDFIFIDRMTMEMKFICVPLEEERGANAMEDVARFVRTFLASLKYDISENGTYVTKMVALANTPEQFNISILVNVLQDLMSEYGIPYDDIEVPETYVDYDADIDASILEGMPESVSVADMEAAVLRDEAARMEAETEAEENTEAVETEAAEEFVEEAGTIEEAVSYDEEAEDAKEETAEAYEEETEVETDAVETYEEEAGVSQAEVLEEAAEDTEGLTQEIGEAYNEESEEEAHEEPAHDTRAEQIIWDDETKKRQQEALRKIAEAEQLKSYGNKSLNLNVANDTVDEEIDEMVAKIEAEAEAETDYGNTQVLAPKKKPHKLELAKETIVRPVFDSVFEPIIESIDGPIEGDEVPRPHVAPSAKPTKTSVKADKAAKKKAETKVALEEDEGASILSQEVSAAAESSLISQLDNRADKLPKVNPYLVRVNNEERIMITKANFKIGKASFGMDYQVTDNGAISRNHCLIFAKDGVYYIRDNKSTNHTYVNGQMVKNGQDVLLTHESTIRIADEDFLFKLR